MSVILYMLSVTNKQSFCNILNIFQEGTTPRDERIYCTIQRTTENTKLLPSTLSYNAARVPLQQIYFSHGNFLRLAMILVITEQNYRRLRLAQETDIYSSARGKLNRKFPQSSLFLLFLFLFRFFRGKSITARDNNGRVKPSKNCTPWGGRKMMVEKKRKRLRGMDTRSLI